MAGHAIEVILSRQLADSLNIPVFIVDPEGNLLFYNAPAEELLGRRFEDTGEMPMEEWSTSFYPTDADGTPIPSDKIPLVSSIKNQMPAHNNFWINSFDGRSVNISATAIPIVGRAGKFVGAMALFWDTESKV
ncbi:MAG: PAS domain-containing protein [Flavobacteriaceae bacterium]|nr:PAS domain-containing protein [Flavobacteriaceae bacterium]